MDSAPLFVRSLKDADLPQATGLFIDAYREGQWGEMWTAHRAKMRIDQIRGSPGSLALCCIEEGALIGVILGRREIRVEDDYFFVDELFVSPARQHRGIGSMLVQHLEHMLYMDSYKGVLLLTLREGSVAEFYSKVGYLIGPRMALFRKDSLDTSIVIL